MLQLDQAAPGAKRFVIMGCGSPGAAIALSVASLGHRVHILDLQATAFERLPEAELAEGRIVPLVGDGTLQHDLLAASIQDSDVFVGLTPSDTTNAFAAQIAKHIYQVPVVVCRVDDPALRDMYEKLQIVAVSATSLVADKVVEESTA